jgi:hypothetical protein
VTLGHEDMLGFSRLQREIKHRMTKAFEQIEAHGAADIATKFESPDGGGPLETSQHRIVIGNA